MLNIHFAPLQGYTDYSYRRLHQQAVGGVVSYTTPFLRYDHEVRNKDRNDILAVNNAGVPIVPQIIAANKQELCPLTELLIKEGYTHIDLNLGCSFPLQTRQHRGAGMLPFADEVMELLKASTRTYTEVTWSVKMRLGLDTADEYKALLPVLNAMRLDHVTLHPRTGRDGFNRPCNEQAFADFVKGCHHPVWWSGSINTPDDLRNLEKSFPKLTDVMIGRGLLARPSLAVEYAQGCEWSTEQRLALTLKMHDDLYAEMQERLQGPAQLLSRMQAFWEYQSAIMPKKIYKGLMKSRDIIRYKDAIDELRSL